MTQPTYEGQNRWIFDERFVRVDMEYSAGAVLTRLYNNQIQALLITLRTGGYELPKGHLEPGETAEQAALRELREETGLSEEARIGPLLDSVEYEFRERGTGEFTRKHVDFYLAALDNPAAYFALPGDTSELRWIIGEDLEELPLINENMRPIIQRAFELAPGMFGRSGL